jgi:hypothetical protein
MPNKEASMRRNIYWCLGFTSGILLFTVGCTLKGTTQEITDTTSNITASTSGRTWWNEDGLLNSEHKTIAFATYNQANVEQDVARGSGEYLASLGALLGTTGDTQPRFQANAQEQFLTLIPADHAARVRQLRGLVE